MELSFMSFFLSAVAGSVITLLTIITISIMKKKSAGKSEAGKEEIMSSIGDLCAGIESLITSNREGILNNSGIQDSLRKKNDEILHLLKPNMHILDVYFVKYIDHVQKEYLKYMQSAHAESLSSAQLSKAVSFTLENAADGAGEKGLVSAPRSGSVEQDLHALENAFFKDAGGDSGREFVKEPPSKEGTRKKTLETIFAAPKEPSVKPEAAPVPEKTTAKEETMFESVEKQASAEDKKVLVDEAVSEEDFTMETIMDLDISKLSRSTPIHENTAKKPEISAAAGVVKEEPPKKIPQSSFSENFKSLSMLADETIEAPVAVKNSSDTFVKPKPVIPRQHPPVASVKTSSKKDLDLTGDDVADKIDSFFGIDADNKD